MRVYRTVEFTEEDVKILERVSGMVCEVDQYNLRDEIDFCNFNVFSGDLERLLKYAESHLEKKPRNSK